VDTRQSTVGPTGQGQFAALDPEPVEGLDGDGDEDAGEEDDDEDDSVEDLAAGELSDFPLLGALSLALAAFRLSVR
jgi:hypothetical protein